MVLTPKVSKALDLAFKVHDGQKRKGKDEDYISHPIAVANKLSEIGADEDVIIAGVLHDTIEDCRPYGSVTNEMLEKEFGPRVALAVNDVTEQDKNLPWEIRKKQAIDHVPFMGQDSLLVKSADLVSNLNDILSEYEKQGDLVFKNFNASKERMRDRYTSLLKVLSKAWPENPLLNEVRVLVNNFKAIPT